MNSYLLLKSLHLLGVVIFLGNIIVTGWWKFMADRSKNPAIIAFAQRQVTLADYIFTASGALLLFIGGVGNALMNDLDFLHIKWMAWGYRTFIISGLIWVAVLIPVQIRQAKMALQFGKDGIIPEGYWRLSRIWNIFGILSTLPLINLYWMVFKPV